MSNLSIIIDEHLRDDSPENCNWNQNTNILIVTVCMIVITVNTVDTMYNSIPENSSSRTKNIHSRYQRCSIKHYRFLL